jgi:YggT family protein
MTPTDTFFTHWYFHIPKLLLAAMLYTLFGRHLLELLLAKRPDVVILKVFRGVTDPVLRAVRVVTPGVVPNGVVIGFALIWLIGPLVV